MTASQSLTGAVFVVGIAVASLLFSGQRAAAQQDPTSRVSVGTGDVQANAASNDGAISGDGRIVAFSSDASNLVPDDLNGVRDVFVRDRLTRSTCRDSFATADRGIGTN